MTFLMNVRTTGRATSASSSAMRISRAVASMSASDRRPLPRRFLKVAARRSERVSNTALVGPQGSGAVGLPSRVSGLASNSPPPAYSAGRGRQIPASAGHARNISSSFRATADASSPGSGAPLRSGHVEGVHGVGTQRADVHAPHPHPRVLQGPADPVQQPRGVLRADLDHRGQPGRGRMRRSPGRPAPRRPGAAGRPRRARRGGRRCPGSRPAPVRGRRADGPPGAGSRTRRRRASRGAGPRPRRRRAGPGRAVPPCAPSGGAWRGRRPPRAARRAGPVRRSGVPRRGVRVRPAATPRAPRWPRPPGPPSGRAATAPGRRCGTPRWRAVPVRRWARRPRAPGGRPRRARRRPVSPGRRRANRARTTRRPGPWPARRTR